MQHVAKVRDLPLTVKKALSPLLCINPCNLARQNFFGAVAVTSAFLPALKRTAQRRQRRERPVVAIVNSFASRVRQGRTSLWRPVGACGYRSAWHA